MQPRCNLAKYTHIQYSVQQASNIYLKSDWKQDSPSWYWFFDMYGAHVVFEFEYGLVCCVHEKCAWQYSWKGKWASIVSIEHLTRIVMEKGYSVKEMEVGQVLIAMPQLLGLLRQVLRHNWCRPIVKSKGKLLFHVNAIHMKFFMGSRVGSLNLCKLAKSAITSFRFLMV